MLLLLALLVFLFFAGVAMTVGEGLWSNTISLLCIMISGLAGAITGAPLGMMALEQTGQDDSYAWYYVFACTWGVFALTLVVLRILTDKISGTRVRFLPVVDKIGGILMGLAVAMMLTSFAGFALLYGPVKAGQSEWNQAEVSRVDAMKKAAQPFYTALKYFAEEEDIKMAIFRKQN